MKGFLFTCVVALCLASTLAASLAPCLTCPTTEPPRPLVRCPQCVDNLCSRNPCNQVQTLPFPGDCTKFCLCDPAGAVEFDCPPGLHFNPATGVCDWPGSCSNNDPYPGCNAPTLAPTTTINPPSCSSETPGPLIKCPDCAYESCTPNMCNIAAPIPYPGDCTKFCICDNNGGVEMNCPPGLEFDPSISACNWPDLVDCSNDDPYPGCTATTTTTTTRPPTTTTTTRAPTTTTTRPPTTTTTTRAPTTTTTAPATTTTTTRAPTTTTTRPPTTTTTTRAPTTTTTRPPTTTTTTRAPTTTTTAPATTTTTTRAPTTTTTRPPTTTTTRPPTTTTTRPPTTTTTTRPPTTTTTTPPGGGGGDPTDSTLPCQTDPPGPTIRCPECASNTCTPNMCNQAVPIPYPGNCTKFCICDVSGAIEMSCSPGLVFNPETNVCDWPDNVDCSNDDPYPGCDAPTTTRPPTTTTRPPTTTTRPPTTTTRPPTTTTRPPTTTTTRPPTTTTPPGGGGGDPTLPCETDPPGPTVYCPECVNAYCTLDMCNQAIPIPYPTDCTKYCICDSAGSIEMDCPPGLIFNPSTHICDWPNEDLQCSNDNPYPGCQL